MCKHAVKKLPYLWRYVPDQYMILENGETIKSVPDYYKNQEMCNKAVDNYLYALKFVSEYFMTQEMCDKAVGNLYSKIQFVPKC